MSELQVKFPSFDYIGGRDVTEKLKEITNTGDFLSLATVLGVPKGTISTWHQRGLTPYEIIIRLHLTTGVSIEYLALGKGAPFNSKEPTEVSNQKLIHHFEIQQGELKQLGSFGFDTGFLEGLGSNNLIILKHDGCSYFIDKNEIKPNQGKYLIDIDGSFSINELQRLPSKNLAIRFNNSNIIVKENEIRIIGKVAFIINKFKV